MWFKRKPKVVFKPVPKITDEPVRYYALEMSSRLIGVFTDTEALAKAYKRNKFAVVREIRINESRY